MNNKIALTIAILLPLTVASTILLLKATRSGERAPVVVTSTPTPSISEEEIIVSAVKKQIIKEHGEGASTLNVVLSKVEGDYAQGAANEADGHGGGLWFAAKVNGSWELVYDGNGVITCDQLDDYPGFPNTLIPQCYNKTTEEMQVR